MDDANEEKMAKVAQLFKNGVESLNSAITSVTLPKSSTSQTLKQNIEIFHSNFKDAARLSRSVKNSLSSQLSRLVNDKYAIENRLQGKKLEKERLKTNLSSQQDELSILNYDTTNAEDDVRRSQTSLAEATKQLFEKKVEQAAVFGVGAVLTAIPFTGLFAAPTVAVLGIVGPSLVGISLTTLEQNVKAAKENLDEALRRLKEKERLVTEKRKLMAIQKSMISYVCEELDQCEKEKQENEKHAQNVEKEYNKVSDICKNLDEGVTYVETTAMLSGVVSREMNFLYNLEQLSMPLQSLTTHLVPKLPLHQVFVESTVLQKVKSRATALQTFSAKEVKAMDIKDLREYIGCEHFLVPAPMALHLIGQVCTLSLKRDFSLEDSMPEGGFKFLKWESFRANLQDITQLVWTAFNTAHVTMVEIHTSTAILPNHLSNALNMLKRTDADFKDKFEKCLGVILATSKACLSLSKKTEGKFKVIIDTLKELEGSCVSAMGKPEEQLKVNKIHMEQNQAKKENIDEQHRLRKKKMTKFKQEIQETESEYRNSAKLPGVVEATVIGVVDLPGNLCKGLKGILPELSKPSTKSKSDQNMKGGEKQNISKEEVRSYEIAKILLEEMKTLKTLYVKHGTFDILVLEKCTKMTAIEEKIRHEKTRLHKMAENFVQKDLLQICEEVIAICKFLQTFKKNMKNDGQIFENERKIKAMESLEERLHTITKHDRYVAAKSHNALSVAEEIESSKSGNVMSFAIRRSKVKSKARLDKIQNLEHKYDKEVSDLVESSEQRAEVLVKMASLKMEKINFEETLDIFRESLKSIAEIRKEWSKLMTYFQRVVDIIDCLLNDSLKEFCEYAKQDQHGSDLYICMMSDEVLTSKTILACMNHVSETYTQVSSNFLLPITKDLQRIPGKTKSDSLIENDLQLYERNSSTVEENIRNLIERKQATFLSQMNPFSGGIDDNDYDFC